MISITKPLNLQMKINPKIIFELWIVKQDKERPKVTNSVTAQRNALELFETNIFITSYFLGHSLQIFRNYTKSETDRSMWT